jgi:hypothetical protein
MMLVPSIRGSRRIDVSAPVLHGCRSYFIFLLFITGMNLNHGEGSSASRDTGNDIDHFILPDEMAWKQYRMSSISL